MNNFEAIEKCVDLIYRLEQKGITIEQLEKLASGELVLRGDTNVGSWQPIETAPKDGTRILVYAHGVVYRVYYSEVAEFGEECGLEKNGWVVMLCDDSYYSYSIELDEPTHWMELPNPPKENENDL